MQYKPLELSGVEKQVVNVILEHVRDMFPTNNPRGHDWQHIESQMRLYMKVGGSVLEEEQFAGVNPFLPLLVILGHDLDRLPMFEPMGRSLRKKTEGLYGNGLDEALTYNSAIDAYNERAHDRMLAMYRGFLHLLGISSGLIEKAVNVLDYSGGKNHPDDPPGYIICNDLDKAVTGYFYAYRCACVGTGARVNHVVKNYLIAPILGPGAGSSVLDENLASWRDDLEWAKDWDPCEGDSPFVIRSRVLHEFADPGFKILRDIRIGLDEQLRAIGFSMDMK